ncbi:MAG: cupin domain-containing protein [Proteobacteria bacterium]|nr:cupin domain-containing protein [Pseudomonadota bacterium]MDA1071951.1 cupin domain-containing protein [Pseudomonadota bacterium]
MELKNQGDYEIDGTETVAEGADLMVSILTLGPGQSVPWHYHSEITDSFVCLEGELVVETRAPRAVHRLLPGGRCAVAPMTAHFVHGLDGSACRFLIVQGVGVYDYVAVGGQGGPA